MWYKGLLPNTTSILPWTSAIRIIHNFTALVIKCYYTFGSMDVFSLTPQHLVICKVSLFSFEQKKVQIIIPVTVTPLCSLSLWLRLSETEIHWITQEKYFLDMGAPNSHTQMKSCTNLGLWSQHFGTTVTPPFFCFQKLSLFSVQCFSLIVFVLWVLSYFLTGDFFSVLNSIRGVLRSSIQAWNYWNAVNVNPTAHLAPYFNSRCKNTSHCLSRKSNRDILRVNKRCSPSIR